MLLKFMKRGNLPSLGTSNITATEITGWILNRIMIALTGLFACIDYEQKKKIDQRPLLTE
jgi:hypothetical protein